MKYNSLLTCLFFFLSLSSIIFLLVTKNSIHALWWLISHFFCTSFIFFLVGIEFLGIILLIIYIGAIAILFLFGIMLLDLRSFKKVEKKEFTNHELGILVISLKAYFIFMGLGRSLLPLINNVRLLEDSNFALMAKMFQVNTTIGFFLYGSYYYFFILSCLILFLALLVTITLTYRR